MPYVQAQYIQKLKNMTVQRVAASVHFQFFSGNSDNTLAEIAAYDFFVQSSLLLLY